MSRIGAKAIQLLSGAILLVASAQLQSASATQSNGDRMTAIQNRNVEVDGVRIHYEVHGEGQPLVMLHGGGVPAEFFGKPLVAMAARHKVIAIHLQGHGRSGDDNRPWTHSRFAAQVVAVMQNAGVSKADVMGYSLGGQVALSLAAEHPERVRRLVIVSAALANSQYHPEVRSAIEGLPKQAPTIASNIAKSPLAQLYPDRDWTTTFTKLGHVESRPFDYRAAARSLSMPTLWVYADSDMISPEAAVAGFASQGGGQRDAGMDGSRRTVHQLAILPGTTHYNLPQSSLLSEVALQFLSAG